MLLVAVLADRHLWKIEDKFFLFYTLIFIKDLRIKIPSTNFLFLIWLKNARLILHFPKFRIGGAHN